MISAESVLSRVQPPTSPFLCLATKFGTLMRETIPGHATRRCRCLRFHLRNYRPFNDDTPVEEQSCIYVPLCAPGTRVRALLLSIPTGSVAETTPSERFGSTFSNPVFHIPDSTIQRCSCVEVGDRRNPGHQPALPSICQDHGEESFHLDDLPFASPHGKADPDEGQSSSADI
ncbi:hypothetical protein B0H14DRAFT_3134138 [Mycena olivaceomarginata]|nr:hypothetical protein B0H14DRAFT_3134138 [Mycena olivaceomarginata]